MSKKEFPEYLRKGIEAFGGIRALTEALGAGSATIYRWADQDPTPKRRQRIKDAIASLGQTAPLPKQKMGRKPKSTPVESESVAPEPDVVAPKKTPDFPEFLQEAVNRFGSVPAFAKAYGVYPTAVYHWRSKSADKLAVIEASVRSFLDGLPSDNDVDFSKPLVVASPLYEPDSAEFIGFMEKERSGESTGAFKHLVSVKMVQTGALTHVLVDRCGFAASLGTKGRGEQVLAALVRPETVEAIAGQTVDLTPVTVSLGQIRSDVDKILSLSASLLHSSEGIIQPDLFKVADSLKVVQRSFAPLSSKLDQVLDRLDGFAQLVQKVDSRLDTLLTVRRREASAPAPALTAPAVSPQVIIEPAHKETVAPVALKELSPEGIQVKETKYLKLLQQFNKDPEALAAVRSLLRLQAVVSMATDMWWHQDRPSVKNPLGTVSKINATPTGFVGRLHTVRGSVCLSVHVDPLGLVPQVAEMAHNLNRQEGFAQYVRRAEAERDGARI